MKNNSFEKFIKILPSLISVFIGLVLGWYLLFITKPLDSFGGLGVILAGGFTDGLPGAILWLYTATPIILTGMSVAFSIRTGLFNIGASGQFTAGACASVITSCCLPETFPPLFNTLLAILAGIAAGALCGAIVGAMKAYFGVSEVITGIMFNYIVMLLANLLIKSFAYNSTFNRSADIPTSAAISGNFIFPIAVAAVLVIKFILDRTALGYELKIIGKNRNAGIYAGINDKKSILLAMAFAGALAGMGGTLMFMSNYGDHIQVVETVMQQGFDGISVALLGMSSPIGVIIAGLFIAHITVGGSYLQLYSYTPDVVSMIVAIIVYCGALVLPIKIIIENIIRDREVQKEKQAKIDRIRGKEVEA